MEREITESTARELIEALDNNAEALKENTIAFNAMKDAFLITEQEAQELDFLMQHQVGGRQ